MRHVTFATMAVAALTLSGCFGGEETPNERTFSATDGVVTAGWAYGGGSPLGGSATLEGTTNDEANTGTVTVTFEIAGEPWSVTIERFAQAEGSDFQDGGVAHGLDEHGDTGTADASIPRIHALVAAWGSASVSRAGELVTQEPWSAHLMVSADTVRQPNGMIVKADGTTPYDPATPADASRIEGDPQALMFVKHPQGETFQRGAVPVTAGLSCGGPQCDASTEIPVEEGATMLDLNVTYSPAGPVPVAAGRATLTIVDAAGTSVHEGDEVQIAPGPTPITSTISAPLDGVVGPLTVRVTGDGAFGVQLDGAVTYVDHPFLVFTWDDPVVG